MKIALVGPTHPFKGGVAAHTTQTAHELQAAGHEVLLTSWARLYPDRLYPGQQAVPDGGPDLPPFPGSTRPLRWDRPWSWWSVGRSLRGYDVVVIVVVVPFQVPALWTLRRALGRGPRVVVIAHNVVPHETHPGGEQLIRGLLRSADQVLVHSPEQARLARGLGVRSVVVAALAAHLPGGRPVPSGRQRALTRPDPAGPVRVLALGMVREYKGYDLLLRAAQEVPGVRVTIAGEPWGAAGERVRQLAADPALAGRVDFRSGYVPGTEVPALLDEHDILALPYRHATASQNVTLGHAYGLPVLATTVGTFAAEIRDGVDGVLLPPDDLPALTAALTRLTETGALTRLRAGVPELDFEQPWAEYVRALTGTGSDPAGNSAAAGPGVVGRGHDGGGAG